MKKYIEPAIEIERLLTNQTVMLTASDDGEEIPIGGPGSGGGGGDRPRGRVDYPVNPDKAPERGAFRASRVIGSRGNSGRHSDRGAGAAGQHGRRQQGKDSLDHICLFYMCKYK
jgi:hypothetical protein